LLLGLLLPIWLSPFFPSSDGPSHLFNSYVFLNYDHVPLFQKVFTLQVPTAGNLTGYALDMLFLKAGLPWDACDKLLATLCILGLAFAFRFAVKAFPSISELASFLIFPFLYNWPMQMGFWSFSLGVPFLLVSVGLYFRFRRRWTLRSLLLLFLAAAGAYLCHPIDWALSALTVGILAVGSELGRFLRGPDRPRALLQLALPVLVFVPFAIPNALFAERNTHIDWQHFSSVRTWLWPLYTATPVHLFDGDARVARLLFVVFVLGSFGNLAWKFRRRKIEPADLLLPAAGIVLVLGLFSPARIGEGTYIVVRLLLFGFLLWALWFGLTLPRRALAVAAALAVLFTAGLLLARRNAWQTYNRVLASFVQLGRVIPPNAFVCQLDLLPEAETVRPLDHAVDLLPVKNFVDVRDYEAGRFAFWTRFRPGYFLDEDYMHPAARTDFEGALNRFEQRTGKHVDYIILTELDAAADVALRRELPSRYRDYQLIRQDPPWIAIYRARAANALP
jgi:hypothetical protein